MQTELNITNFFTYYMFHPNDETLQETDRKTAKIATAILGVFTVGLVHLICRAFFYDREVKANVQNPPVTKVANRTLKASKPKKTENIREVPYKPVTEKLNKIDVQIVEMDNICNFDAEAIVNAANSGLKAGSGVCGAIKKQGGGMIFDECKTYLNKNKIQSLPEGEAMITSGGKLKAKHVIHAVGPDCSKQKTKMSKQKMDEARDNLYKAYYNCLVLADQANLKSIAFPSLSTGIFRFPLEEAGPIAMRAFSDFSKENEDSSLETISMVMRHDTFNYYKDALLTQAINDLNLDDLDDTTI